MPIDMKNIISETFIDMVRQKGLDKITVKALIEACNISRQTFYYHFQDIMDVVEWSVGKSAQNMLSRSLEAESPEKALEVFITSAAENQTLISKLLNSHRREEIEKTFLSATRTYLQEMLKSKVPESTLSYSDLNVMLDFWACGITGLLFKYCSDKNLNVSQLADQIYRLLSEQMIRKQ